MVVLPTLSVLANELVSAPPLWLTVGKWFVFWAVGWRLLTTGLSQVARPAFTLLTIFRFGSVESAPIVRELGFANVGTGLAGIVSMYLPSWRVPVAFASCVFLGTAAAQHAVKGSASREELVALLTDAFVFLVLAVFVALSFILG